HSGLAVITYSTASTASLRRFSGSNSRNPSHLYKNLLPFRNQWCHWFYFSAPPGQNWRHNEKNETVQLLAGKNRCCGSRARNGGQAIPPH
ncbi:hypothetical protein ACJ8PQ_13440, partial [Serratia sp. CY74664]|uniref:hypothetical protein n=1 Tax=Serratia sp. CY74664 TaxID=3383676 RepID=UPI003FA0FC36